MARAYIDTTGFVAMGMYERDYTHFNDELLVMITKDEALQLARSLVELELE